MCVNVVSRVPPGRNWIRFFLYISRSYYYIFVLFPSSRPYYYDFIQFASRIHCSNAHMPMSSPADSPHYTHLTELMQAFAMSRFENNDFYSMAILSLSTLDARGLQWDKSEPFFSVLIWKQLNRSRRKRIAKHILASITIHMGMRLHQVLTHWDWWLFFFSWSK